MQKAVTNNLTISLIKAFSFGTAVVFFIWFMYTVISAVLLFFLAIVFAIIINAPVTWLENKKLPRTWSAILVFTLIFFVLGLLSWLIIPMVSAQLKSLIANLPHYVEKIETMFAEWRVRYFPWMTGSANEGITQLPTSTLMKLGGYSISFLGSLILFLLLLSFTAYMVINPRPLLEFYLSIFPIRQRDKAERAFVKTSSMLIAWMRANVIGGAIQAICVIVFLSLMKIPGAWVWGALAFIAQMIPKIGFFLMAVPPILVALSISPITALWVLVFFLVMSELLGDFVMPKLQSSSMNLHPVAIMFVLLVLGSAFGFVGILLSTPVAAFLKAYYEEFYLNVLEPDGKMKQRVNAMIQKASRKNLA